MVSKERIIKELQEYEIIQNERQVKYYQWLKTIVTISIGLFGIIVSFQDSQNNNYYQSIFFIISLFSLSLGILFALITLYSEVHLLDRTRKWKSQLIQRLLSDEKIDVVFENIVASPFYTISKKLCYLFYLISLFSLVLYSIFGHIFKII